MSDPIVQFGEWLQAAKDCRDIAEPTAFSLATADASGQPSVRIVLLKAHDERGFVFYTNYNSHKGRELLANPKAALCFYWMKLLRQVRIEGVVEKVSDAEADAYFAGRPRESQLGAWASKQSEPLADIQVLRAEIKKLEEKYHGQPVPRPPHWSGFRVTPARIEFWQQGDFRIHERRLFVRSGSGWEATGLYP